MGNKRGGEGGPLEWLKKKKKRVLRGSGWMILGVKSVLVCVVLSGGCQMEEKSRKKTKEVGHWVGFSFGFFFFYFLVLTFMFESKWGSR